MKQYLIHAGVTEVDHVVHDGDARLEEVSQHYGAGVHPQLPGDPHHHRVLPQERTVPAATINWVSSYPCVPTWIRG